jgi:ribosomal protein S12 methylthiotransferase
LPDQVPAAVAQKRQRRLMTAQRRISRRKLRQKVGKLFPVLVEGRSEETDLLFRGRLESQAPEIDGHILINDFVGAEPRPGEFRWARVTDSSDYDLVARLEAQQFMEPAAVRPTDLLPPRLVQISSCPSGQCAMTTGG